MVLIILIIFWGPNLKLVYAHNCELPFSTIIFKIWSLTDNTFLPTNRYYQFKKDSYAGGCKARLRISNSTACSLTWWFISCNEELLKHWKYLIDNDVQLQNYLADDKKYQILDYKFSIFRLSMNFISSNFQIFSIHNALLKIF